MHRFFIAAAFLFALLVPVSAQERDDIDGNISDNNGADSKPESIGQLIDYNMANNIKDGFSAHKQNYILPLTLGTDHDGRDGEEIKFQISIKQRIIKFHGWACYFGFTQKSFWQAYDYKDSRPFRENNFNPEFFLRTKMWSGFRIDLGAEHESNGQSAEKSRSWNRVYLTPYFENSRFIVFAKGWYRLQERKKENPSDTEGDDNPDSQKYYGYGELGVTLKIPELHDTWLTTLSRYNFVHNKGAVEATLTVPMFTNSMKVMVQYREGYGESLIDYNRRERKVGFGFNFTR